MSEKILKLLLGYQRTVEINAAKLGWDYITGWDFGIAGNSGTTYQYTTSGMSSTASTTASTASTNTSSALTTVPSGTGTTGTTGTTATPTTTQPIPTGTVNLVINLPSNGYNTNTGQEYFTFSYNDSTMRVYSGIHLSEGPPGEVNLVVNNVPFQEGIELEWRGNLNSGTTEKTDTHFISASDISSGTIEMVLNF